MLDLPSVPLQLLVTLAPLLLAGSLCDGYAFASHSASRLSLRTFVSHDWSSKIMLLPNGKQDTVHQYCCSPDQPTTRWRSYRHTLEMKVTKNSSKSSQWKGSTISETNHYRTSLAGRRGTKNFVDPCKLFVGNLHFNVTEKDLLQWFKDQGISVHILSIKVRNLGSK